MPSLSSGRFSTDPGWKEKNFCGEHGSIKTILNLFADLLLIGARTPPTPLQPKGKARVMRPGFKSALPDDLAYKSLMGILFEN